jgi:hypothetical protein
MNDPNVIASENGAKWSTEIASPGTLAITANQTAGDKGEEDESYLGGWGLSDLTENYFCTEDEARAWFDEHEMALSEVCCMAGWDYIQDNIDFPNLENDCQECPCCEKVFPWDEENPDENYWNKVECPCHDVVCIRCVHYDEGGNPVCPDCGLKV